MSRIQMKATVISCDTKNTGNVVLQTESRGEQTIWGPTVFGGEFAPYPKEGTVLTILFDTIEGRVVEAFDPALATN